MVYVNRNGDVKGGGLNSSRTKPRKERSAEDPGRKKRKEKNSHMDLGSFISPRRKRREIKLSWVKRTGRSDLEHVSG